MSTITSKMSIPTSGNTIQTLSTINPEMSTITSESQQKGFMKGKNFIMTINEASIPHTEEIINYLSKLSGCEYILVCEHIGQENKHYHLYAQFDNCKRISFKKLFGAHIETAFGSAQQNISYVKAEDDKHKKLGITSKLIYEKGEPKLRGNVHTIKEVKQMTHEQREQLNVNMFNIVKKIEIEQEADIDVDDLSKKIKVYYIQGPSGIGKTQKAKEIIKHYCELNPNLTVDGKCKINMIKYENGFYIGVGNDAKIALYDDFRDSHMKASEFINFIDYNIHYMNIKGGSKQNKFELILITSVQRLNEIYANLRGEPREQWERRIEIIDMYHDLSYETSESELDINLDFDKINVKQYSEPLDILED